LSLINNKSSNYLPMMNYCLSDFRLLHFVNYLRLLCFIKLFFYCTEYLFGTFYYFFWPLLLLFYFMISFWNWRDWIFMDFFLLFFFSLHWAICKERVILRVMILWCRHRSWRTIWENVGILHCWMLADNWVLKFIANLRSRGLL
jgi:hypothetical protein